MQLTLPSETPHLHIQCSRTCAIFLPLIQTTTVRLQSSCSKFTQSAQHPGTVVSALAHEIFDVETGHQEVDGFELFVNDAGVLNKLASL